MTAPEKGFWHKTKEVTDDIWSDTKNVTENMWNGTKKMADSVKNIFSGDEEKERLEEKIHYSSAGAEEEYREDWEKEEIHKTKSHRKH